jgi:hypothetical protein
MGNWYNNVTFIMTVDSQSNTSEEDLPYIDHRLVPLVELGDGQGPCNVRMFTELYNGVIEQEQWVIGIIMSPLS